VQDRRTPPHQDVRQPAQHSVAGNPQLAAAGAPTGPFSDLVGLHHPARQHGAVLADALAGDGQTQSVDQTERVEIRAVEIRLSHVEVFPVGSVRTPIIGGPRPSPPHRRANPRHTLDCEEPDNHRISTLPILERLNWSGQALPANWRLAQLEGRIRHEPPQRPAIISVNRFRRKDADWGDSGFVLAAHVEPRASDERSPAWFSMQRNGLQKKVERELTK